MKTLALLLMILVAAAPLAAAEVESRTTTIEDIRRQVSQSSDIDVFVQWLKARTNVSDVHLQPILLTTAPPQQWVGFSIGGKRYRFRLMKGMDMEVSSVGGSDRTVVKGKVVLMGEDRPVVKK